MHYYHDLSGLTAQVERLARRDINKQTRGNQMLKGLKGPR